MLHFDIGKFLLTLEANKRLLCLDFGQKKIGIACSDTTKIIANPYKVYIRQNTRKDLGELNRILCENQAAGLVIGLPFDINGEHTEWTEKIMSFAEKIAKKSLINIYFHDESFSTVNAVAMLNQTKMSNKKARMIDDKIAACMVLQQVLDEMSNIA